MNYCIRHDPCPECRKKGGDRSGNNLAVYSDGHSWCFSCGYYESNSLASMKNRINKPKDQKSPEITLPQDLTKELPHNVLDWLLQYDIQISDFYWSPSLERLIYPVYINGNLVAWQGRGFNPSKSKYYSVGQMNKILYFCGDRGGDSFQDGEDIIVVEDVISALVVGKVKTAMPLWGSSIGPERLRMLSELFKRLYIWLDKDKAEYSLKSRLNASLYFDEVQSIITDKDPKCYGKEEIQEILQ